MAVPGPDLSGVPTGRPLALCAFAGLPQAAQALAWLDASAPGPDRRRIEHRAARALAAQLLQQQGAPASAVGRGARGEPLWPAGFTGSLSHSRQIAAAVVLPLARRLAVGIDVEGLLDAAQAEDVAAQCLLPEEVAALAGLPREAGLTLAFSAKESFFKCTQSLGPWDPDFLAVRVVSVDVTAGTVDAAAVRHLSPAVKTGYRLAGTFHFAHGHVFTAFTDPLA